jgi:NADH-quinone oxidoreductase subunit K
MISIYAYLCVATFLFLAGIFIIIARKNIIGILIGIELIFNGAALNFVAYSKYNFHSVEGHIFPLFIIVVAAAEAAVALGIAIRFFQLKESVHIDDAAELKY